MNAACSSLLQIVSSRVFEAWQNHGSRLTGRTHRHLRLKVFLTPPTEGNNLLSLLSVLQIIAHGRIPLTREDL